MQVNDVWTVGDWDDIETSLLEEIANGRFEMQITLEQCEGTIAEYKIARNKSRDNVTSLTREWNDLSNLKELYKSWPVADLQNEAKKYGAEVCRKKVALINNIIMAYEQMLLHRIEISEQAIQDLSESISRFERYAAYLKAQQVEVS